MIEEKKVDRRESQLEADIGVYEEGRGKGEEGLEWNG